MTVNDERELVRQQSFHCDGPLDIDVDLGCGRVEVRLVSGDTENAADTAEPSGHVGTGDIGTGGSVGTGQVGDDTASGQEPAGGQDSTAAGDGATPPRRPVAVVQIRHEPGPAAIFGLAGLVNWFTGQFGGAPSGNLAEQAVRDTVVLQRGNLLTVRGPKHLPLRSVPLSVTVHAPAGSAVHLRTGSADIGVGGPAGRVEIDSGSGDVSVEHAGGPARLKTGSGSMNLGQMLGGLSARSGSGDLQVSALAGESTVHTGSGDVWLGTVQSDRLTARTGSGDLTVADAATGQLQLVSGSGDLRVGIRAGVLAEVDVVSGSGRARSDLPPTGPPEGPQRAELLVRARTGSGEAVIGAATA